MGALIYYFMDFIICIIAGYFIIFKTKFILNQIGKSDSKVLLIIIKILGVLPVIKGIRSLINLISGTG